jgi:hypothetical protein
MLIVLFGIMELCIYLAYLGGIKWKN